MAITEQARHKLHQRLDETLGTDEAATLMEHLPPVGWGDVATKTDLRGEIDHLRTELKRDIADLRHEIADVRTEMTLRFEKVDLRFDHMAEKMATKEELANVRTDIAEMGRAFEHSLRINTYSMLGGIATLLAVASAVQHYWWS